MNLFIVAMMQQNGHAPNMFEDRILFVDTEALVIDKPAGLAVHPGPKTPDSLEDHLPELRLGFMRSPVPVHRLDRDTSGCLLLARNPKALKRFARAFEEKRVEKNYIAVLDSVPGADSGRIELPLKKISSAQSGWKMVVAKNGLAAETNWRLLDVKNGRALISFTPETGRTHQIRVHAAEGLGNPISGDPIYGTGRGPMLLHAISIRLEREGKRAIEAEAPLPESFAEAGFAL